MEINFHKAIVKVSEIKTYIFVLNENMHWNLANENENETAGNKVIFMSWFEY